MSRSKFGRTLVCAAILPVMFIVACSKRAGLDRGDANERVLDRSRAEPEYAPSADAPGDDGSSDAEPPSGQFASAPASGADDARARPQFDAPAKSEGAKRGEFAERDTPRRSSGSGVAPSAPAAPKAQADAYSSRRYRDETYIPREKRPGLGTSWGESRRSVVSTVAFQRENPSSPTSIARIYYNNPSGIAAQTGQRSISALGANTTELSGGFVSIEIVDPQGVPLPGLSSAGRSYVVGHDGDRYAIRIRNQESFRIEVVATVDGLDVIDGAPGTYQKRGYVIDAYSTLLIEGFRRSTSAVAAFRFGAVSDSYAARTSGDRHVGVIGVALFAERGCCVPEYSPDEVYRRETADPFPNHFSRPPRPQPQWRAD